MPSSHFKTREVDVPSALAERHPPDDARSDTSVGIVTELPAANARRKAPFWPWLAGLLLVGVAVVGWLAPWAPPPVSMDTAPHGVAVSFARVELGDMTVRRRHPGELFADAVEVTSRIAGHVAEMPVRIGDAVDEEQVLSRLDDAVLRRRVRETEAQIRAQRSIDRNAGIAVEAARRDVERARGLVSSGAVSRQEIDELETALRQREAEHATAEARLEEAKARLAVLKEDLRDTTIRAPFAGVVARRDVDPGAFVQPGMPLLRIVAEEPLRIRFRVPEHELADVAPGLLIELDTRHASGRHAMGQVKRLSGELSPNDRTLLVEGIVDAHEGLRPGMYADVVLQVRELKDARIVPGSAFVERVDSSGHVSSGVFVVEDLSGEVEHASARWVAVRVLGREGDRLAIEPLDGAVSIESGMRVLVRGHRELDDGARIRLVDDAHGSPEPRSAG